MQKPTLAERAQIATSAENFFQNKIFQGDTPEAMSNIAKFWAKIVLQIRSINAVHQQELITQMDAAVSTQNIKAAHNLRRFVVEYGFETHQKINNLRNTFDFIYPLISEKINNETHGDHRRFAQEKLNESMDRIQQYMQIEGRFIGFLQTEIEPHLNRLLLQHVSSMNADRAKISADLYARYPIVTGYLAR